LIGTSILHAIKKKLDKEIITFAYDIESDHRNIVSEMGIATFVCDNISEAVKDAELVILAIPVGAMETVARSISPHLKSNTLITDTGFTKASVIKDVNTYLPENVFLFLHIQLLALNILVLTRVLVLYLKIDTGY